MFNQETIGTIRNRLTDWLITTGSGGSVTDLPLDLINRAQAWLVQHSEWQGLVSVATLTVTDRQATLPSNCAKVIRIGADSDGDNKLDFWYRKGGDYLHGYDVENSFDEDTGHSWTLTFYQDPTFTPVKLIYQKNLSDYTAEDDGKYSFFPGELLTRCAQKIRIEETGLVNAEVGVIQNAFYEQLTEFKANHQYNNDDGRFILKDDRGNDISMDGWGLGYGPVNYNRSLPNSFLR
jgi:hypothetical protein